METGRGAWHPGAGSGREPRCPGAGSAGRQAPAARRSSSSRGPSRRNVFDFFDDQAAVAHLLDAGRVGDANHEGRCGLLVFQHTVGNGHFGFVHKVRGYTLLSSHDCPPSLVDATGIGFTGSRRTAICYSNALHSQHHAQRFMLTACNVNGKRRWLKNATWPYSWIRQAESWRLAARLAQGIWTGRPATRTACGAAAGRPCGPEASRELR